MESSAWSILSVMLTVLATLLVTIIQELIVEPKIAPHLLNLTKVVFKMILVVIATFGTYGFLWPYLSALPRALAAFLPGGCLLIGVPLFLRIPMVKKGKEDFCFLFWALPAFIARGLRLSRIPKRYKNCSFKWFTKSTLINVEVLLISLPFFKFYRHTRRQHRLKLGQHNKLATLLS